MLTKWKQNDSCYLKFRLNLKLTLQVDHCNKRIQEWNPLMAEKQVICWALSWRSILTNLYLLFVWYLQTKQHVVSVTPEIAYSANALYLVFMHWRVCKVCYTAALTFWRHLFARSQCDTCTCEGRYHWQEERTCRRNKIVLGLFPWKTKDYPVREHKLKHRSTKSKGKITSDTWQ